MREMGRERQRMRGWKDNETHYPPTNFHHCPVSNLSLPLSFFLSCPQPVHSSVWDDRWRPITLTVSLTWRLIPCHLPEHTLIILLALEITCCSRPANTPVCTRKCVCTFNTFSGKDFVCKRPWRCVCVCVCVEKHQLLVQLTVSERSELSGVWWKIISGWWPLLLTLFVAV